MNETEITNLNNQLDDYLLTAQNFTVAGNYRARFDTSQNNNLSKLGTELNIMLSDIEQIIENVTELTRRLNKASLQIMSSVAEQNSVANQQSSSVTEISSTMEELSATSRQIAMNASSVLSIAEEGVENTEAGVTNITELQKRMQVIDEDNTQNSNEIITLGKKSNEISKVMEIIKSIADQTKLIAFNAALEAASAGESGKRFGIVAVEIRRLADNVTESTKEIAENINDIQSTVNKLVVSSEKSSREIASGVTEAEEAGITLKKILESAHANADAARQISTSTQQQDTASNQVVMAIKEISIGAKSSMQSVQETGESIEQLARMAVEMDKKLDEFELGKLTFEWNKIYELNIKSIDQQHQKILEKFNEYNELVKSNASDESLEKTRQELVKVCRSHFEYEESLFEKHNYELKTEHIGAHEEFINFLEKNVNPGQKKRESIIFKMKKWLNSHILVEDQKYRELFQKAGVK